MLNIKIYLQVWTKSSQCCKCYGPDMLFPKGSTVLLHPRMMAYATAIITVSVHKFAVMVIINGSDADLCLLPPLAM